VEHLATVVLVLVLVVLVVLVLLVVLVSTESGVVLVLGLREIQVLHHPTSLLAM
jgi:hypothetical protein